MGETIKRSKMGRPPLPPGERRGASMGFRPTPQIRAKLEQAAHENGRSMSQEVEARLEASFLDEEARNREMGGKELQALFRLLGAAAEIIEARTGRNWSEDWETGIAVFSAWQRLLVDAMPKTPAAVQKTIQDFPGVTETLSDPDLVLVQKLIEGHPGAEMTDEYLQSFEAATRAAGKLSAEELQVGKNIDATAKENLLAGWAAMGNIADLIRRSRMAENIGREAVLGLFPEKKTSTSAVNVRGRNAKSKKA